MAFTVGELSRLTGITVRALHHYDDIGLVTPSDRTAAGYRLYDDADVRRLQQVLLLRELELPLAEIAGLLADPTARERALRAHRELLIGKRTRLDHLLATLDATLDVTDAKGSDMRDKTMTASDVQAMFAGFDHAAHADEAAERWGETTAYRESARRKRRYGKPEWDDIRAESAAIYTQLATHLRAGTAVGDPAVQALVEAHRAHIERWFYPCSPAMHRGLGEMYVADPRFTATFDAIAPGLARFVRDAFAAAP